jgi:hypothetical protein
MIESVCINRYKCLMWVVCGVLITSVGYAQDISLEGNWELISGGVEGAEYSTFIVDDRNNVTFSETYPNEYEGVDYIFAVDHTGKFTVSEDGQVGYVGVATGEEINSNGEITAILEVLATGTISDDGNMIAGFWYNKEHYQTPEGDLEDEDGLPFVLIREGYDPGTPGEAIAGVWELTIEGDNISWTGQTTLDPNGSMIGEYASIGDLPAVPLAGFYSYSEDKEFEFEYTTSTSLPIVGETTFTVYGEGQGNEDNTEIAGTWVITVEVSVIATRTFEGTFVLKKVEETPVSNWTIF